jgi:putative ABC transport system permease protein
VFGYYLRLATLALRRNVVLTVLMITAIGIGIGASMTTLTVFYAMSGNPLRHKNDVLYVPLLDNWGRDEAARPPNDPPDLMTYRDATYLRNAGNAKRVLIMMTGVFPLQPEDPRVLPLEITSRLTTHEFFPMFEPPFLYGSAWDRAQDDANARVVVLSRETNQKVFGGVNSVGREIHIANEPFTVVGVLDDWHLAPKVYDPTAGAYNGPEDAYMPFAYGIEHELQASQNNSCFKDPGQGYKAWLESDCIWLNVWVELNGAHERAAYRQFLDNYVMEQKKLGRFARPLNNRFLNVEEWLDFEQVVRDDARIQMALSLSFLAVCLINTVGLLLAKFMGRAGEIGLRRALGASRKAVFAQYLTEAGIIGLCGGLLGLALTAAGLAGMRSLDDALGRIAHLDVAMVGAAIALAVGAALLAGILPTWRACLIAPATQLKSQ